MIHHHATKRATKVRTKVHNALARKGKRHPAMAKHSSHHHTGGHHGGRKHK